MNKAKGVVMAKKSTIGQENPSEIINSLIEENESLKAVVSDYSELKKFAEEVVEKHNTLVVEYKNRQTELQEEKEENGKLKEEIEQKDHQIIRQKEIIADLDKKLVDFQNHINRLIEKFNDIEQDNNRLRSTVESLEKYIEIMDQKVKPIKNERGAGRKKKYTQEQIDKVIEMKNEDKDYDNIVEFMDKTFDHRKWDIKEIKYIYSRYK